MRIVMCIDPRKPGAAGLWRRARQWIGIGVTGLTDDEKRHCQALRDKILADSTPLSGDDLGHLLPGLGPHPEAPPGLQRTISISPDMLAAVAKKIVRGCEYWLANGRIIEQSYDIDVLYVGPENLPASVAQLVAVFGLAHLGPGLRIRRGAAHDDQGAALYEIVVWDSLSFYAAILPPEAQARTPALR